MEWCSMDVETHILCWASRQNRVQSSVWKVAQLDSVGLRQSWGRSRTAASQEIRCCCLLFLPSQMHRVHTHPVCWMPFLVLPSIYAQAFQTVSNPPFSLSLPPPQTPIRVARPDLHAVLRLALSWCLVSSGDLQPVCGSNHLVAPKHPQTLFHFHPEHQTRLLFCVACSLRF
jgi:hypothetical protein